MDTNINQDFAAHLLDHMDQEANDKQLRQQEASERQWRGRVEDARRFSIPRASPAT